MKYMMKKPCDSCPFVIAHEFHLTAERVEELRDNRGEFPCHQTVDYNQDWEEWDEDEYDGVAPQHRNTENESHCVGHLIVSWADWGGFNQIQAMTARMGEFKPEELPTPKESGCFNTWEDMVETNRERDGR